MLVNRSCPGGKTEAMVGSKAESCEWDATIRSAFACKSGTGHNDVADGLERDCLANKGRAGAVDEDEAKLKRRDSAEAEAVDGIDGKKLVDGSGIVVKEGGNPKVGI